MLTPKLIRWLIACCLMLAIPDLSNAQPLRISNLQLEPINYDGGPGFLPGTHAFITFDMLPGEELHYFNARLTHEFNGEVIWAIRNLPIPPLTNVQKLSYRINVEQFFGEPYESLLIEYDVSTTWVMDPTFPPTEVQSLLPIPTTYRVFSGSDDPALTIGSFIPPFFPPIHLPPVLPGVNYRGCEVPNIDLDYSNFYPPSNPIPDDFNACGPAAAANSLHWLVQQHPELAGDTSSLRTKLDLLKKFMSMQKDDPDGVRFDSMVVGKLTLIDSLKLPIRVKYKTKHESGNTDEPLASTNPKYGHAADNQGSLGVYPDFDWFKSEMDDGEDVEVHVGWYDPPDNNGDRARNGGHWLVATGYYDGDNTKGVFLKDDNDQSVTEPDSLRHEYYEWDTLPGGIPFLRGLTDFEGRIGIVESLVSESYDPNILFTDVSKYDWSYRPVIYLSGGIQEYPYHAWLTFWLPVNPDFQFFNARVCSPDTAVDQWLFKNIPLPDVASPFPVRIKVDLGSIVTGDTLPAKIILKYHIGSYREQDTFPIQSYAVLPAAPEPFLVPSGGSIGFHPLIPSFPPIFIPPIFPLPIDHILRGCEVPNIDLDSLTDKSDWNACGPAAAANSLQWLDDQHEEIDVPIELRPILDSLKSMMKMDSVGVDWMDFIKGKLEFIDLFQLPIHVKYQAHANAPSEIPSPNPLYGHRATNESPPNPDDNSAYLHPTFDFLCQELEAGEDVEMMIGYYCDTFEFVDVIDTIEFDTLDDGTIVMDTFYVTELVDRKERKLGHMINITGKMSIGPFKWITYKHDVYQGGEGGTSTDNTPEGYAYTDLSEWIDVEGGYAFLERENYIEMDGDKCTAYVEMTVSESYDPDIEFCPDKVCNPNDDGEGSLRTALVCFQPDHIVSLGAQITGDTIELTSAPIVISSDVTIECDPSLNIYIKGSTIDRVFEILPGVNVTFDGLRIICGESQEACSTQNAGNLLLRNVEFYNHDGGSGNASQIINTGSLRIEGNTNLRN